MKTRSTDNLVGGIFVFVSVTLGIVLELARPFNWDAGWYLYIARRVIQGERLYRDLLEINPPMIVTLNLAPAWLAMRTGVSEVAIFRVCAMLGLGVSLLLSALLLQSRPRRGISLLPLLSAILFIGPGIQFGQREHILTATIVPYVLLALRRAEGAEIDNRLAMISGVGLAIAVAIKPHFLLVPLLIEFGLRRRRIPLLRPELAAGAVGLLVYVLTVVLLAPGYLDVIRMYAPTYTAYRRVSFLDSSTTGGMAIVLFVLLGTSDLSRRRHPAPLLVLATLGAAIAAVVQRKAWPNHYYPAIALGVLTAWMSTPTPGSRPSAIRFRTVVVLAVLMVLVPVLYEVSQRSSESSDLPGRVAIAVRHLVAPLVGPGDYVAVLSMNPFVSVPLVNDLALTLSQPVQHFWTSEAAALAPRDTAVQQAEARVRETTIAQLAAHPPAVLLVEDPAGSDGEWARVDLLKSFNRSAEFRRVFSRYRLVATVERHRIYQR